MVGESLASDTLLTGVAPPLRDSPPNRSPGRVARGLAQYVSSQ